MIRFLLLCVVGLGPLFARADVVDHCREKQQLPSSLLVATLRFSPEWILETIARQMGVTLRDDVATPSIYFERQIPLEQFQQAVLPQWGFAPHKVINAYAIERNEIYLIDEAEYYNKTKRFIDDSLAHELVHYIQVKYKNSGLHYDDTLEFEAIDLQTWFRETYLQ